ncbi:hypothetical protein COV17_03440 [Candidatus Woesearchaeota archaeon CG10_big_fil_rev_8_21_14_0_10_36_11]|nr:MAG: hypothetical protein COV17_03440 [Candidatus Woesearchaeota archaeon CG10_big_fil_rev_8_21_14_0_10_36_11]
MEEEFYNPQFHSERKLPWGGEVHVLNKESAITEEDTAMMQALYSRSLGGFRGVLEKLRTSESGKFMNTYYIGYGHKSIGDCGETVAFIDGVSMLTAKALQDSQLYKGQESSTRYIDFSQQPFFDPTNSTEGKKLLEEERTFYLSAIEPTAEVLMKQHPREQGQDEKTYTKAIRARAFDITRSLLPAGAQTNVSWTTNMRLARDRLLFLRHHPLQEVRTVAETLEEALREQHPNSFPTKRYPEQEAYQELIAEDYYYHCPRQGLETTITTTIDKNELWNHAKKLLTTRPEKTELPKYLAELGTLTTHYTLDFGSFRDIQRHRAVQQRMPLLTTELGFHPWYEENLAPTIKEQLPEHLERIKENITSLGVSPEEAQYYTPMGYLTTNKFTGDLPAVTYLVELRNSRFIHPTLRTLAGEITDYLEQELEVPLHVDKTPGEFDIKRGEQDITEIQRGTE